MPFNNSYRVAKVYSFSNICFKQYHGLILNWKNILEHIDMFVFLGRKTLGKLDGNSLGELMKNH